MVKVIVGQEPFQRAASLYLHFCVFVLERNIAMADEFDANDEKGTVYAVVYDDDQPVSTGRFLAETKTEARLTRIATLADYRGQGYGAKVIEALETYARQEGFRQLTIHSELTAQTFYESLGYQAYGPKYLEDGEYCQSLVKTIA